ncbi:MAG TPA: hypothetical protein VJ986_02320 [Gaiellaceae bacterium]|nr:hypothetical protein [Gaiellaceae bacterium]
MWFLKPSRSTDDEGRSRPRLRQRWSSAYTPRGNAFTGRLGRGLQEDAIEREIDFWTAGSDEDRRPDDR